MARSTLITLAALLATTVDAQFGNGFQGVHGNGDPCPPWASDCNGSDDGGSGSGSGSSGSGSSSSGIAQGALFSNPAEFSKASRILIAHAVLASLVWVLFIPSLAILLRLNLKNPIIVKIHAVGQILSYIIYTVAAGMGVWLARQTAAYGTWSDPHPKIGLGILVLALLPPIFGAIHHSTFKKRAQSVRDGKPTKPPGRNGPGLVHVWLGRGLIILGMINGGLGIRLASSSPFQTQSTSTKVKIAYAVVAATMFLLYLFFVINSEIRRVRNRDEIYGMTRVVAVNKDGLPSYDESEESFGNGPWSGRTARGSSGV